MHQRAGANYQNRKRSISVAGRCITRIEQRAESPGHEEKKTEGEQENSTSKLWGETKNEAVHTPQGPVPLLTPYVPRRLNVPLYAEIMKITNSPAPYVRARTYASGVHWNFHVESFANVRSVWTVWRSTPRPGLIGNCRLLYLLATGAEDWGGRKQVIAWNTFEVPISRLATDRTALPSLIPTNCHWPAILCFVLVVVVSLLSGDKCLASRFLGGWSDSVVRRVGI